MKRERGNESEKPTIMFNAQREPPSPHFPTIQSCARLFRMNNAGVMSLPTDTQRINPIQFFGDGEAFEGIRSIGTLNRGGYSATPLGDPSTVCCSTVMKAVLNDVIALFPTWPVGSRWPCAGNCSFRRKRPLEVLYALR